MRALAAIVALVAMTAGARADNKHADELFQKGREQLAAKDYKAACDTFAEAFKLDPTKPGTMLNLGLCNEGLSKFSVALKWFRRTAARANELRMDPEYIKAADERAAALISRVATIRVIVENDPPPADMIVKIDGEQYQPIELNEVLLDFKAHHLVAKAAGMKVLRLDFNVISKDTPDVKIRFEPGDSAVVVDRGKKRKLIAIAAAATGGAVMAFSGIYAGVLINNWYHADLSTFAHQSECSTGGTQPKLNLDPDPITGIPLQPYCHGEFNRLNHFHNEANAFSYVFAAGAAIVVGAAVLYFTAPSRERREEFVIAPVIAPDQLGFAASGRF